MKERNEKKVILPGIHQCVTLTNEHWQEDENGGLHPTGSALIILLHGYSESAAKIYKRLGSHLNEQLDNTSIMAINGLYPLPRHFPLSSQRQSKEEGEKDLLAGFAWYFYDQRSDQFLIDYAVPVTTLCQYLKEINPKGLKTSFIGYSQGGYLAPFLGLSYPPTKQVLGINCSFRYDLIKSQYPHVPFVLNQVQGNEDTIIDIDLSAKRFQSLKRNYNMQGEFQWVEEANHRLDSTTRQQAIELFKKYNQ